MISSNGLSGGIIVLWDTNVAVFNMIDSSNQCIIGDLLFNNNNKWRVAAVYANKECSKRRELWDKLAIHSSVEDPMVVAGDFNCLTSREDKKGGRRFKFTQGPKEMEAFFTINDFHEFFDEDLVRMIGRVQIFNSLMEDYMELKLQLTGKSISVLLMEDGLENVKIGELATWVHKLKINARVKLFLWRIYKDEIPTEDFLYRRRISGNYFCPMGYGVIEDLNHITSNCSILLKGLKRLADEDVLMERIHSSLIWFVWTNRSKVKHGKIGSNIVKIVVSVISFCSSAKYGVYHSNHWDAYQSMGLFSNYWHPPPPEWLKINIDASLKENYEAGIGQVVRDDKGRFVIAFGHGRLHWDIAQMELSTFKSLKEALQGWTQGAKGIIVEGDNKNVLQLIQ
ncbi:uncharacterized protein LOC110112427 [Dendrobium catenatum]|uniref:uncharacterized protein LOC110112427 n=1 Tax=Dendrobium catenatum TaxID=906689 RepID=UPI00109F322E|nr:uncharacterized protein LOC110112427 [Dendrobium catenatum]